VLCVVSERGLTQSRMAVTRTCENRTSCDMPLTASTKYTYSVTHCTRLPSPAMARRSGLTPRHATPRHATPRHATPIACTHADAACGAQPHGSVPTGHGGVCSRWLPTATGRLAGVQSLHTLHKVCADNFRVWEASACRWRLPEASRRSSGDRSLCGMRRCSARSRPPQSRGTPAKHIIYVYMYI
jgi:hypothetical protein